MICARRIFTAMCEPTRLLVSCAMRPYSPGKAAASMRKLIWPSSWRRAMSVCAASRLRNCNCILCMALSSRPVSSLNGVSTSLSSVPPAIASAARVARPSGWVRLRVISRPSAALSRITSTVPATSNLRESSIDFSATDDASAAILSCKVMFSAILSCQPCMAGAALVSRSDNASSLCPVITRSMTLSFKLLTWARRVSISARNTLT